MDIGLSGRGCLGGDRFGFLYLSSDKKGISESLLLLYGTIIRNVFADKVTYVRTQREPKNLHTPTR